jgi:hypothetical protein
MNQFALSLVRRFRKSLLKELQGTSNNDNFVVGSPAAVA